MALAALTTLLATGLIAVDQLTVVRLRFGEEVPGR